MTQDQQDQRDELKEIVLAAMHQNGMSAAAFGKQAGVTGATMTKITNGQPIKPFSEGKIRKYLHIAPLAETQARAGYSVVIEVTQDMVGTMMRDRPEDWQRAAARRVLEALMNGDDTDT